MPHHALLNVLIRHRLRLKAGIDPIGHLTLHGLRRTYASLRCLAGDDTVYTASQLGHTDHRFTLNVYTHALKRRGKLEGEALKEYDRGLEWAKWASASEHALSAEVATSD